MLNRRFQVDKKMVGVAEGTDDPESLENTKVLGLNALEENGDSASFQRCHQFGECVRACRVDELELGETQDDHLDALVSTDVIEESFGGTEK